MRMIPNKSRSTVTLRELMIRHLAFAAAVLGCVCAIPADARAGPFEVKGPEVEKGETEVSTNHVVHSGFPANAERIRHSFELLAGYAFTSTFKAAIKTGFDTHVDGDLRHTTAGVEAQYFLGNLAPAITWAWFVSVDTRMRRDETNTVTFGPLVKFGDDKLALTVNPLFERTFGPNREDGIAFAYAVGLKGAIREGMAFGVEAVGSIPEIGNAPGASFQEHRIGPVLYIDRELSPPQDRRNATKLSLEIGTYVGLTDATPDWTGRIKASLTW
jgi:hypothetical protein